MKIKIFNWLLVFLWMGVIFFFSHQPDLKSSLPDIWDFIFRKIAHITEYAILTWLLFRALYNRRLYRGCPASCRASIKDAGQDAQQPQKTPYKRTLLAAVIFSILYAISDEYHQTFVFGREGCLRDVLVDSLGILLVVWLIERKMIEYKKRISKVCG